MAAAPRRVHVVAVDGSPGSDAAFEFAVKTTPPQDSFLIATGVFHDTSMEVMGLGMSEKRQKLADAELKRLKTKFDALCTKNERKCDFKTIEFATVSQLGLDVNRVADSVNAKSIVVGSRGFSSVASSVIMGSVSNSILHQASRPVTVVRPNPTE
jgi:nucleotide-binding universal stress UspA family protein